MLSICFCYFVVGTFFIIGHVPGRPQGGRHGMVFGQIPVVPSATGSLSIPLVPGSTQEIYFFCFILFFSSFSYIVIFLISFFIPLFKYVLRKEKLFKCRIIYFICL